MKSIVCTELGNPELLEIMDVQIPVPSKDEVLVKVEAAGVNYPDALLVQGRYQVVVDPPFTPGNEICGYIEEVGENVNLSKGTKVIGLPEIGGFSEYVTINKNLVIPISDSISSTVGASLPINYGTTYYALKRRAKVTSGESLLILEKEEYVKNVGANHVIRYDKQDLKNTAKEITNGNGVDVVVDPVGGNVSEEALRATAWNGRLLVIGFAQGEIPKIPLNITLVKGVSIVGVWWGRWTKTSPNETAEDFKELIEFIDSGKLDIEPKNVYSLEETSIAMNNFLNRKNIGKTVIEF